MRGKAVIMGPKFNTVNTSREWAPRKAPVALYCVQTKNCLRSDIHIWDNEIRSDTSCNTNLLVQTCVCLDIRNIVRSNMNSGCILIWTNVCYILRNSKGPLFLYSHSCITWASHQSLDPSLSIGNTSGLDLVVFSEVGRGSFSPLLLLVLFVTSFHRPWLRLGCSQWIILIVGSLVSKKQSLDPTFPDCKDHLLHSGRMWRVMYVLYRWISTCIGHRSWGLQYIPAKGVHWLWRIDEDWPSSMFLNFNNFFNFVHNCTTFFRINFFSLHTL
jgi:hypothetical protein